METGMMVPPFAKEAKDGAPGTRHPASGGQVVLTAKQTGSNTNYPVSVSWTNDSAHFPTPSFTLSGPSTLSGGTDGVSDPNAINETYSYDPWGNMQRQGNYNFTQPYSANNQIEASGYSYDAAGDLLSDGIGDTYTYNVDGRVTASNGAQYVYDALGQMVAKIGGTNAAEIIYFGGQSIAFRDASTGGYTDLIRAGNRLIAEVAGTQTATPIYRLVDHLGSLVMTTDNSGAVTGTNVMTPYGQTLSSNTSDPYPYAGLMLDTDGTYVAQARKYAMAPARWLRPDPYNGSYDLANPQSMNRYVYAMDNPVSNVDPSGLVCTTTASCTVDVVATICPVCGFLGPAGSIVGAVLDFYPMIQAIFGLGLPAQMNGNAAASQSGKNVPQPSSQPCDPVSHPCLTVQVNGSNPTISDPTPSNIIQKIPLVSVGYPWSLTSGDFQNLVPGTHWCGPGGWGGTTGPLDAACMAHDACYGAGGFNAIDNINPFLSPSRGAALQQCNQSLCNTLNGNPAPGAVVIDMYFSAIGFYSCTP